ncbi:hypothetical protein GCM10010249_46790 [Streptomyces roseolilacinus]|uniref:Uncharacterized protein n=1 Tax=Streptomyces roseolilacinus TaxID=66904 RepID=A0A918B3S1_9ACTN|nr:hypothetical protein GCM10010249_46790 [Streptomyces roseolilacinus]
MVGAPGAGRAGTVWRARDGVRGREVAARAVVPAPVAGAVVHAVVPWRRGGVAPPPGPGGASAPTRRS